MRIVRVKTDGGPKYGIVHGAKIEMAEGDLFDLHTTGETMPIKGAPLLAPLVPTDILCIGLNYRAHAAETGATPPANPMLFIKSGNALAGPGEAIRLPRNSPKVDFEAELVVVIGKTGRHIPRERALEHVFGYTCANDVSARDWQKDKELNGGQFARGKSFDGFCPIGPWIVTTNEVKNPNALRVSCRINGQTMQDGNTADMIFDVAAIVSSLSETMTLRQGAVILTGTPAGVGVARTPPVFLKQGDLVEVEVEQVGTLVNRFEGEQ